MVADGSMPNLRSTAESSPCSCILTGTSYMLGRSGLCTTHCFSTLQNEDTLSMRGRGSSCSARSTRMSGCMPRLCRLLTECCVGLVFSSPAAAMYGTYVRCRQTVFPGMSHLSCRMASRNGRLSMSPMVPPISVMMKSYLPVSPRARMFFFISSVM